MDLNETLLKIDKFTKDRDWEKYHTPSNLSKSISIEAAELLECFQWSDTEYKIENVKEELADVLLYSLQLAMKLNLDPLEIINEKMKKNAEKYPVEKAYGKSTKYNEL